MTSLISPIIVYVTLTAFVFCSYSYGGDESRKQLRNRGGRSSNGKRVNPSTMITSQSEPDSAARKPFQLEPIKVHPSRVIPLSWRPRVFLYRGFFSDVECDQIISWGQASKHTGRKAADSGKFRNNSVLPNSQSLLKQHENMLAMIEERISSWTLLPKENSEPLQVMHYGFEEEKQTFDYFGDKSTSILSGNLMATLVIYLSNVIQGGEILFRSSEIKSQDWSDCANISSATRPVKGNAILFFSVHLNASLDTSSFHARCPVTEGEMWCATKFFYVRRRIEERKGLSAYDGGECSDEDENCPRWAALGECQQNPVFMVGSPDYYGTCRKSCGAC